jgi:hypothetical protein
VVFASEWNRIHHHAALFCGQAKGVGGGALLHPWCSPGCGIELMNVLRWYYVLGQDASIMYKGRLCMQVCGNMIYICGQGKAS